MNATELEYAIEGLQQGGWYRVVNFHSGEMPHIEVFHPGLEEIIEVTKDVHLPVIVQAIEDNQAPTFTEASVATAPLSHEDAHVITTLLDIMVESGEYPSPTEAGTKDTFREFLVSRGRPTSDWKNLEAYARGIYAEMHHERTLPPAVMEQFYDPTGMEVLEKVETHATRGHMVRTVLTGMAEVFGPDASARTREQYALEKDDTLLEMGTKVAALRESARRGGEDLSGECAPQLMAKVYVYRAERTADILLEQDERQMDRALAPPTLNKGKEGRE